MTRNNSKSISHRWQSWILTMATSMSAVSGLATEGRAASLWAYVGTYTQRDSQGIYVAKFETETGGFGAPQLVAETANPSFLAIHPSGQFLYAVGETDRYEDQETGFVQAFRIDRQTGQLTPLNSQRSGGTGPCHLVVDATGRTLLVANYGGGSVSSIALREDGRLGDVISSHQHQGSSADGRRQQGPHAHSINLDASNRFAYVADLGLDKVLVYRFDAETGQLTLSGAPAAVAVSPGSGPRHFALAPNGQYAYVINELSSTLVVFRRDPASGSLEMLQEISTLPDDFTERSSTAEVVVHPTGRFVYGSNRGHDSIAVFQVDPDSGQLARREVELTQGRTPRNFVVDPTGQFLLAENQGSDTVVVFRIDAQTGELTSSGEVLSVPVPVCIRFLAME
jgi:6-phosphogluconolactonase